MNTTSRNRLDDLFARALEVEPADRAAFLERSCGNDDRLRAELDSLLAAHQQMGEFLDAPASAKLGAAFPPLAVGEELGGYRVLGSLGEGGHGRVYEAQQQFPNRRVALKVMRAGPTAQNARRRLVDEASILARLRHPGIAHVYDAGVAERRGVRLFWVALERIERGRALPLYASEATLSRPDRVRLLAEVCDAVHHGHQQGVLHRDLKPGNVLIDGQGRPKVIDFGIAHVLGESEPAALAGTLPYMSPEQCRGEDLDVRSDVFALGVMLFELLVGELPRPAPTGSFPDAAARMAEERCRALPRSFDRDLAAITARALDPDRELRYDSSAAMADDLRRALRHRPVEARPATFLYVASRLVRRQPFAAVAVLVALAVLVAAVVVNVRERREAEWQSYVANVSAAAASLRLNSPGDARLLLERAPEEFRGWEWNHLMGRIDRSSRRIEWPAAAFTSGAVSPDGAIVVGGVSSSTGDLAAWNARSGTLLYRLDEKKERIDAVAFSPDGRRLVTGSNRGAIVVRRASDGVEIARRRVGDSRIWAVAYAPDGSRIAAGCYDGAALLLDPELREEPRRLERHEGRVFALAFLPDGSHLLTGGGADGLVCTWRCDSGQLAGSFRAHADNVEAIAVSPGSERIVTVSMDMTVRLWERASNRELAVRREHRAGVKSVAFAPDGTVFATASADRTVRIWSGHDAMPLASLRGHTGAVRTVAFSGRGDALVSWARDGSIRFWDPLEREDPPALSGYRRGISAMVYSADGRRLITGSNDGRLTVCDVESGSSRLLAARARSTPVRLALRSDGSIYFLNRKSLVATVADYGRGATRELALGSGVVYHFALTDDLLLTAHKNGSVAAWRIDRPNEGPVARWRPHPEPLRGLVASGEDILAIGQDGHLLHWRRDTPADGPFRRIAAVAPGTGPPMRISRDATWIAIGSETGAIQLRPLANLERVTHLESRAGNVRALDFSPDGRRLASGGSDGAVRLWDVASAREVVSLHGHRYYVISLAWSPDGRTLASGGGDWRPEDCIVRLWHAAR